MTNYYLPLQPDTFYHVYNRGNNGDKLFYKEENYRYFLQKFGAYISGYADAYAYCLLSNHFHFLLKTKRVSEIAPELLTIPSGKKTLVTFSEIVSEGFRRFFMGYSKAIKKQEGRTGSLFEKNFKRKEIKTNQHLFRVINYIHRNAETHGLVTDFRIYPHSSYPSFLSVGQTKLKRDEVLELFGGRDEFIRFHLTNPVVHDREGLSME